ncbi:MAG TPA: 50S ribosomal protein L1 [Candidatus Brocadiia bacterium]|nr:50S ribosomal protein L1 [Candidatus Brocadiia bacterium]
MAKHSKRYETALSLIDREKRYTIVEAIEIIQKLPKAKFEESLEVSMKLGIDPKHSEQQIRGSVALPNSLGKTKRVIAFAEGQAADDAKAAGAIEVGGQDLVEKIQAGWTDFDVAVASPDMMRFVGRLGRVLGPQGKMPSPKSGTVNENVARAVKEFSAGRIEYRNDNGGNLHAIVGKISQPLEKLQENVEAFINHIRASQPPGAKGTFIQKIVLSSSMGPGLILAV